MELSRLISHCVWLGTFCIDIGAFTPFLWIFQQRERVYTMLESWIGARLTTTLTRVGGMGADIPDGWTDDLANFVRTFPKVLDECSTMLTKNAIWVGRTVGLGAMSAEEAVNYGPLRARCCGERRRVRRPQGLPVPRLRDVRLRRPGRPERATCTIAILVRMEEMRPVDPHPRAGAQAPPRRPGQRRRPSLILPPKSKATSDMESMIHHFKQVMEGPRPPIGEAYVAVESPKGEKGYYMVSTARRSRCAGASGRRRS
jgi:NADH-quinone oxidoreductase subunit D